MTARYHPGELAVQRRAGVEDKADHLGKIISSTMPLAAQEFLRSQPFVVLSSVDVQGRLWGSVLTGQPGFLQAVDERNMAIDAVPSHHDPLCENLQSNPSTGMLVIEFATRRRMRVNGKGTVEANGHIKVHTEQVYANCQKYIQARQWEVKRSVTVSSTMSRSEALTPTQQSWIKQADTFFIGSYHPESGADASHRGGNPGFVKVLDEKTLLWPDYAGNNMFSTLGNIAIYPNVGLLFMDFEQGATLQLTGKATVIWNKQRAAEIPGTKRLVQFQCMDVIETRSAVALGWSFMDYSPFNPG